MRQLDLQSCVVGLTCRSAGLFLFLFFCFAASAKPTATVTNTPAWPPPPAEPRIVYVHAISSAKDIGARPSFFARMANAITGVSAEAQQLNQPFGLSLDDAGNLLVTDTGSDVVFYLDFARKKWQRWTAASNQSFVSPVAAVHAGKLFYVADSGLGCVIAFDEKGKLQFEITNHLTRPTGLARSGDRLVIVDAEQQQVVICGLRGEFISAFGQRGGGAGEFNFPTHVAVDAHGQIYVTDSLNQRIQVFTADGTFVRTFGGPGDGPGTFTRPKGVAFDAAGHVYVVDAVFGNVQIFNDAGRLLLDFSGAGSEQAQLWLPNAIAINSRNEIFVADGYNHRIQMFRYTGRE